MEKTPPVGKPTKGPDTTVPLNWKAISEAQLDALLNKAKSGRDPAAAKQLIEYFYRRIHANEPYNQTVLLEYLHHAFGKIVEGQTPGQAFGI